MPAQNSSADSQPNTDPNIDVTSPYTPRRPSPIISISVNHPIGTMLRKIKNFLTHKQTLFSTTFTIKITPIVAIVSLFGLVAVFGGGVTTAFNYGKTIESRFLASIPTPTPKVVSVPSTVITLSRVGTIKATYQFVPTLPQISVVPQDPNSSDSSQMQNHDAYASPTPVIIHFVLVNGNSVTYLLNKSGSVSLSNYLNMRVLLTGSYNSLTNTLTIVRPQDIEILP